MRSKLRHRAFWRDRRNVLLLIGGIAAVALYPVLVSIQSVVYGTPVAFSLLLGAAAAVAPVLGIRYPIPAIVAFSVSVLWLALIVVDPGRAPWPWPVPLLLAFAFAIIAITLVHGWLLGLILFAAASTAGMIAAVVRPLLPSGNALIVTTSVVGAVYLLSVLLAARLSVGDALARERAVTAQEQERRELVEERARIARELHDVVAHGLSVIQVQASTARYRLPTLSEDAIAELEDIAANARSSLTEMRRLLGVLRTEDQSVAYTPQQGLDDIPALVDSARRAGARIGLEIVGTVPSDAAAASHVAGYRLVQEALSNAMRHAPGALIAVRMDAGADALRISIRNLAPDDVDERPAGHGIRGMRERATLLGGTLDAGRTPGGEWLVQAVLPWRDGQTTREEQR